MTCPRCHFEFEKAGRECPECGVRLLRSVSGILKTSAVMIAAGEEQGFYPSVHDVPEPLRTRLLRITTSSNSGTIVIADRAGKQRLTRLMARREAAQDRSTDPAAPPQVPAPPPSPGLRHIPWLVSAALLTLLALAAALSFLFELHW